MIARAPPLDKRIGQASIEGRVVAASALPSGIRLLLEDVAIRGRDERALPRRVRITVRASGATAAPGDQVRVRAVLMPPPGPALPGAFDFQRKAFFDGLGAVGYAVGRIQLVEARSQSTIGDRVARLRQAISARVRASLPGSAGAIAATLMTGDRGAIAARDLAAMRDSGLAHLLAISGLHIGLIAAILFFTVRGLLALAPRVALNYPIKKWAAAAAMLGAFAYLLITGLTIPTQRAFLMTSIVLLAVILDRSVISMGLVAWAAAVVLLLSPESLLGPSFQMSFAAVVALIAAYEVCRAPMIDWLGGGGIGRRVLLYFMGIGLTTLVAGLATTPFAIFHFNRFVAFGLAANLVAVPVMALWIMPWAMLAYVLMPFGLERLALVPMGTGIDLVLGVAHTVAAWPGAVWLLPPMPTVGLVLVALGGLWLCLWRRAWRLAGIAGIAMGFGRQMDARSAACAPMPWDAFIAAVATWSPWSRTRERWRRIAAPRRSW